MIQKQTSKMLLSRTPEYSHSHNVCVNIKYIYDVYVVEHFISLWHNVYADLVWKMHTLMRRWMPVKHWERLLSTQGNDFWVLYMSIQKKFVCKFFCFKSDFVRHALALFACFFCCGSPNSAAFQPFLESVFLQVYEMRDVSLSTVSLTLQRRLFTNVRVRSHSGQSFCTALKNNIASLSCLKHVVVIMF